TRNHATSRSSISRMSADAATSARAATGVTTIGRLRAQLPSSRFAVASASRTESEHESGVVAAEPERVRKHGPGIELARRAGDDVEHDVVAHSVEVGGREHNSVLQREQ